MNTDTIILNVSKLNPTAHKKKLYTMTKLDLPRVSWMVQHMQINQCDTPHEQKKRYNHLNSI